MANVIKVLKRKKLIAETYRSENNVKRHEVRLVGSLSAKVKHPGEEWVDLGVISEAIVTQSAIAQLISVLQAGSATTLQSFKFHATGTGNAAESSTNTSLGTEVGSRVTGTQVSLLAGNYHSEATIIYTAEHAITEHGLFSASSGGVLFDRSKFAPILVESGTTVVYTYDLTVVGS